MMSSGYHQPGPVEIVISPDVDDEEPDEETNRQPYNSQADHEISSDEYEEVEDMTKQEYQFHVMPQQSQTKQEF